MDLRSRPTTPQIPTVDVEMAAARPRDVLLLDVREDAEWVSGRAIGAVHVPLGRLDPGRLPSAGSVYVICRSGNRSAMATQALIDAGVDAHNVAGGMNAWIQAGFPVERG